ncbi:DUF5719 family protein [Streptomyces sp. RFCAC02]|uniref:DUF5719 family protein n=1 Tax=Streptomyces sp. RFCAC02 TaxID=2499143 RepID=UPI00101F61B8|nr:DUF5719 family protein [Streptomyces sp. RFCAC02]
MNRTLISLVAAVAGLGALTGAATLRGDDTDTATLEQRMPVPVERSTLTCPRPTASESATTWYTAYTPPLADARDLADGEDGDGGSGGASAALVPAPEYAPDVSDGTEESDGGEETEGDEEDTEESGDTEPVVPLEETGIPVTTDVDGPDGPALTGTAEGALAPGWTVQQTTRLTGSADHGVLGTSCQTPDTEFWFAGASTAGSRRDYVHLTNPDPAGTVVDIELYGPEGPIESETAQNISVPGGTTVPVRLGSLTEAEVPALAVHVTARTGRIGAQVEAVDATGGADWLPPSDAPDDTLVIPGIPANARSARLVAFTPAEEDVVLDVGLAGATGTITPAGHETIDVKAGTVTAVDLGSLTQDEAGSLVLSRASRTGSGPVFAALQVTLGGPDEDDPTELAFIPVTGPVDTRATVSGNTASGTALTLVAPDEAVEATVTISAGAGGGEPVTESYTVDGRTTLEIRPELPDGTDGPYALTVATSDGPLYAARVLTMGDEDAPEFTVQTLTDDRSTVAVPDTEEDLAVLTD